MTGINPDKVNILYDRVLIKLPKPVNDTIEFESGVKLYLDTSYEPARHTMVTGTVVKVCKKFTFDTDFTKEWLPQIEVSPGDSVILDYFQILNNMGSLVHRYTDNPTDMYLLHEGSYYVFVDYHELWAKKTDAGLVPLNGYIIYKGIVDKTTFGVYVKEDLNRSEGIVVAVGGNNLKYREDIYEDVDGVNVGDHVVFRKDKYRKLEYDTHATENKDLYLVQKRYIMGVLHAC